MKSTLHFGTKFLLDGSATDGIALYQLVKGLDEFLHDDQPQGVDRRLVEDDAREPGGLIPLEKHQLRLRWRRRWRC